jgi:hypothetical protein
MPIITIYRGASQSGEEIAEAVAAALNYPCWGRDKLVEAARRYGALEARLGETIEKDSPPWDRRLQDIWRYRVALQAALCEAAQGGAFVYHGHLAHELLRGISHVVKVLLTAPLETRVEQVRARQNITQEEARRYVEMTDAARSRRLMAMFGADWRDPSRYDLVFNLERMSAESAIHLIIELAKREEYRPTVASQRLFANLALTVRVQVALTSSPRLRDSLIDARAEDGHVYILGNSSPGVSEDEIVALVKQVPGVIKVSAEIGESTLGLA